MSLPPSLTGLLSSGRLSKKSIESRPSLLILRHSDRPTLPPRSAGGELFLTPPGQIKARQLGACLTAVGIQPGAVLMATPMTRTVQSLLSVCAGANWHNRMEFIEINDRAMGIGTIFDRNLHFDEIVGSFAKNMHTGRELCDLFNEAISNQRQYPGVKPFPQSACAQLAFLKTVLERQKQQQGQTGLSIVVAHDLNLACLLAYCFKMEFTTETWPPFLDGVLLQLGTDEDDERIRVFYGDKSAELDVMENF